MAKRMVAALMAMNLLACFSQAQAQNIVEEKNFHRVDRWQHAGVFRLLPDGQLVRKIERSDATQTVWFQADNAAPSFFNIGDREDQFFLTESISHGDAIQEGAVICGFELRYATSQITGTLDVVLTYYDDGNATVGETSPVAASFALNDLPKADPKVGGNQGWIVTVDLDPEQFFSFTGLEFQYGIRRVAGNGLFGPSLQLNVVDQTAGQAAPGTVGTTYNFFEIWNPPGQVGGTQVGGYWLGATGPWAANGHKIFAVAAPAATVDAAYVVHNGFTGAGSPNDSSKVLYKETATPTALTYDNLINSSRGINGIGFNISGTGNAAAITAADFVFEMCELPFTSGNPTWIPAPAPASVVVTPGTPDQIVVSWNNNEIANRWLRATVLGNANTGLAAGEVYYIGHLLGESGPAVPTYTVAFADITPIRAGVGSTVGSESPLDIDKNGIVAFADISSMRSNVGAQLGNLTVPPPAP